MDRMMIQEWNERVLPDDTVYHLGDVAFTSADKAGNILQQLNGRKILIEGNHDRKLLTQRQFRDCFAEVHQYLRLVHDGTVVVMFHYPIQEWDQMHRGAVHFHGHVHGKLTGLERYRVRDAGMDATGQIVWNLDDAVRDALRGEIKTHHPQ
jgi:calcineurin-like phosphoesterase family protein